LQRVTEDDIKVLLDGYEAWNKREFDVLAEVLDPEIEWQPGVVAPEGGVHRGADGFKRFVDSWLESFDEFHIRPELLVQAGDRVAIVARQTGRGHGSGIELEARVVHVWTIRDGRAVGWWGPRTLDEALAALGDERLAMTLTTYERFNCGDLESLDALDPEITWHTWIVPGPGGATYRGHEGVRELWSDARNVFAGFRNEPERIVTAGDRMVVFVCVRGQGKESGVEVEGRIAHVLTFRGEKVVKVESYEDREEALRVVGVA
jgi:ketosteroid isomerase-like protein